MLILGFAFSGYFGDLCLGKVGRKSYLGLMQDRNSVGLDFLGGFSLLRVIFSNLGFGILVLLSACLFLNLPVSGVSVFVV